MRLSSVLYAFTLAVGVATVVCTTAFPDFDEPLADKGLESTLLQQHAVLIERCKFERPDADETGATFADEPTTGPPPTDDETSPLE